MREREERVVYAPVFVLISSLLSGFVVWLAVVKAVGYSVVTGFFYFAAYFIAMILFFMVLGYSLFRQRND